MCSCYSISLQKETYVLSHFLCRLNNSRIHALEKANYTRWKKKHLWCAPSSESMPTCAEAVDQNQQFGERLKYFSSFGTDWLL